MYAVDGNVERAQRQFWTEFRPTLGQNRARKAGMKQYEKKRKNENRQETEDFMISRNRPFLKTNSAMG